MLRPVLILLDPSLIAMNALTLISKRIFDKYHIFGMLFIKKVNGTSMGGLAFSNVGFK